MQSLACFHWDSVTANLNHLLWDTFQDSQVGWYFLQVLGFCEFHQGDIELLQVWDILIFIKGT